MLNVKQGSCEHQLFETFGPTRQGMESRSTDYEADTLTTRLRIIQNDNRSGNPIQQQQQQQIYLSSRR